MDYERALDELREALSLAQEKLVEQDQLLRQLTAPPLLYGTVLSVWESGALVVRDESIAELTLPPDKEVRKTVVPGVGVLLNAETLQIVKVSPMDAFGDIAEVRKILGPGFLEVDYSGSTRIVYNGVKGIEAGDRVILDRLGCVVTKNLGKEKERFIVDHADGITWRDIGGLESAKEALIEAVELPHRRPDLFKYYGKRPANGVLLYGPPGCGKTMLGKATATAVAHIHKKKNAGNGFLYVKGPEILDRYVGTSEATIRQMFSWARQFKHDNGYPGVVFVDEADAILHKRGTGISSDVERTIVPMFLTEMNGLEDSGAIIILATNRADILDPAITREGRIDRKIKIDRPNQESARSIFEIHLKSVPFANGDSKDQMAAFGAKEIFSPKYKMYEISRSCGDKLQFTMANIVHGGMIAGIVDRASSIALHRDMASKKKKAKTGILKDDLAKAVRDVFVQNRDLGHNDELAEFIHDYKDEVVGIQRLHQSFD